MASANVVKLSDQTFEEEVLKSDTPVVVDFWAEWCGPCRTLAPVIEELADEYKGKVKVGKVDTDANRSTAMTYSITAIPTIIVFNKGKVARKFIGLTPKKDFKAALDGMVAASA
jgi:thioredoxin 1